MHTRYLSLLICYHIFRPVKTRPTLESSSDHEDMLDRFFEENAGKLFRGVREISRRSTSEQRAAHNARYARPTLKSSCDNEDLPP